MTREVGTGHQIQGQGVSIQEAEAIPKPRELRERWMAPSSSNDGNIFVFQQDQEGSPVVVPQSGGARLFAAPLSGSAFQCPPDDPPPPWRATGTAPKNNGPDVPLSIHPRHPTTSFSLMQRAASSSAFDSDAGISVPVKVLINAAECLWSLASTASYHCGGRHLALVLYSGSRNHRATTSTQW